VDWLKLAIGIAELLVRWKSFLLKVDLVGWYIKAARWEDARRFAQEEIRTAKERDFTLAIGIAYAWVLIHFHAVQQGHSESDEELYQALGQALKRNIHVPSLLMKNIEYTQKPDSYGVGEESEAIIYVFDNSTIWSEMPGAIEWLLSAKERYGPKPHEEAFIQLLRRQIVYVEFLHRPAEKIIKITFAPVLS
jgi:hypothetical protein